MAYLKRLADINLDHQEKAIVSHAGFIRFVTTQVKKEGMKNTLSDPELKWLRKQWERVIEFAEQVQYKQMPLELGGPLIGNMFVTIFRNERASREEKAVPELQAR